MRIFKIIFKTVNYLFMSLIILYLSFIILQRINGNKSIFGYRLFTIASNSMKPKFSVSDVVIVKDIDYNKVKVGDDVAYIGKIEPMKGQIITHRVVNVEKNNYGGKIFITKGINNLYEDQPITGEQIVGKVKGILPIISTINHVLKNIYGFFFLVFCPIIFVMGFDIAQVAIEAQLENGEIEKIDRGDKEYEDII